MERQKKLFVILLAALVVIVLAYAGIRIFNRKQEEADAVQAEEGTVYVTDMAVEDITAFSYYVDGELLSFTKDGDEWKYDGDGTLDMDESAIESMLLKAAGLTASEALTGYGELADYGLAEPANTITLTTAEGTVTLYVGDKNAITSSYYLKASDSDVLYLVSSGIVTGFNDTLDELITVEGTELLESTEN